MKLYPSQTLLRHLTIGTCLAVALLLSSRDASAQTYNANADFSIASNPNGVWTYNYNQGGGPLTLMTASSPSFFGADFPGWGPGVGALPAVAKNNGATTVSGWDPGVLALHPSAQAFRSVVTWTAPSTGLYDFTSTFTHVGNPTQSDGIIGFVTFNLGLVGESSYGSQTIAPSGSYSLNQSNISLLAGNTISWQVDANTNQGADSTVLGAVVTAVPEPSTTAFLILGSLAMGAVAVKHRRQRKA